MQRQTQLANDIWPLLLPRIQAMITAAASGSGGGSGAVNLAAHDLGGSLHRGTLRSDQAPQFLLTDGTRSLAGSLAVDAGVTIDGVDISAHAADINAHHAKLHGIIDAANHSVTGSQYQIVGLTAVNTLGLLTPSATPAANAVVKTDSSSAVTLVDLTVTSDLFLTGYLDFGTDVMYEDASYLQVTGSKAVRFGQNIGNANWTVYNAGGAQFGGNVDIISGGDLTVGSNVLFVDNSLAGVGINMAPDPQFALDINGPARATYWIGPHAIQLKGVLLLAHYDGRAPYATNFSGEPNGHMGQVATVAGGVIYRPGKFYKAAQFSHTVTNLITNPRFGHASYLTGWTSYNSPTTAASTQAYIGTTGAYVQTAGAGAIGFSLAGLTNGVTYTASVYVTSSSGTWPTPYMCNASFGGVVNATLQATTDDGWRRYVVTKAAGSDGTLRFILPGTSSGVVYSNAQIEQRAFVTPYADGLLGDGHAWSGTAHASTSTRTAATLDYPAAGNITAGAGTIMAWVWVDANDGSTNTETVFDAGTAYNYCSLYMTSGTTPTAYIGGAGGTVTATGPAATVGTWAHVALTWGGGAVTVYTNGVAGTPVAYSNAPALHTAVSVGYARNLGNRQLNGYIDDFCILDRAAPAAEMRSIYESNAPVFAETSTFSFRPTPKGLIWADDEGLWMRDTAGKPVLGVYGGEAATKNWGGFNLVPGDLLLGNNAVGSSAIWWSRVNGKFGFYGAGSGTPQVEIATDGSLMAGAGKVRLNNADGFTAFNASNAATIYINADGIAAADGGARTTVGSWTSGSRFKWYSVGEMYAATPESYLDDSSISRTLYPLVMRAIRQGNDAGLVEISAVNTSNVGAFLRVGEGFRLKDYYGTPYNTNRVVHASATDIILECTNLQLVGLTTNTTQSTGTGTLKMAGTTSRNNTGFVRVTIGGTVAYIPYFTTITG